MTWMLLGLAIAFEVTGTIALKLSDGMQKIGYVTILAASYGLSFYLMSLVAKVLPVSIVYAIWSGVGLSLITLVGWLFLKETLQWPVFLGMGFVIIGVVMISLYSNTSS
ncbi:MAG: DMT family transporter [Parvibaculales bacterium]